MVRRIFRAAPSSIRSLRRGRRRLEMVYFNYPPPAPGLMRLTDPAARNTLSAGRTIASDKSRTRCSPRQDPENQPRSGSSARWLSKMMFFERTSVGLLQRPTTHSFQNLPLNHSENVSTS